MDLNWLRDFECLARTLNFTRAAEERNITQSAFSRRIKALESWAGAPLINRATYPVQLTEAGSQLLPVAQNAVTQLTETRSAIRADDDRGTSNFVRFSVLHTISANYLAGRIDDMQNDLPDLRTRVVSDSLSTCCELLIEGAVDIMLCYYHRAVSPRIDEAALARKDLHDDHLIPVAAATAARTGGWNLDAPGAAPIPYLAYERSSFLDMVVDGIAGPHKPPLETIYIDGLVETVKRRVLQGAGVAWLPQTAVAAELSRGDVVPVGGGAWRTRLKIAALSDAAALGPAARQVWDLL